MRTFGGFVGHVANSAYSYCSRAKGEANPNKEAFEKVMGKRLKGLVPSSTERTTAPRPGGY